MGKVTEFIEIVHILDSADKELMNISERVFNELYAGDYATRIMDVACELLRAKKMLLDKIKPEYPL